MNFTFNAMFLVELGTGKQKSSRARHLEKHELQRLMKQNKLMSEGFSSLVF